MIQLNGEEFDLYKLENGFTLSGENRFTLSGELRLIAGEELKIEKKKLYITLMNEKKLDSLKKNVKIEILKGSEVRLLYHERIPIYIRIEEGSELIIKDYLGTYEKIKSRGEEWFWIEGINEYSEEEWIVKGIIE